MGGGSGGGTGGGSGGQEGTPSEHPVVSLVDCAVVYVKILLTCPNLYICFRKLIYTTKQLALIRTTCTYIYTHTYICTHSLTTYLNSTYVRMYVCKLNT